MKLMRFGFALLGLFAGALLADDAAACSRPRPIFSDEARFLPAIPERPPFRVQDGDFVGIGRVQQVLIGNNGTFVASILIDRVLAGVGEDAVSLTIGPGVRINTCWTGLSAAQVIQDLPEGASALFLGSYEDSGDVAIWGAVPMTDPDASWIVQSLTK